MASKKQKHFEPIEDEAIPLIHSLIDCSVLSVEYDNGGATYELCVLNDRYLRMSRNFIADDKGTNVIYSISLYNEEDDTTDEIAHMETSVQRRIFMPSEQKIIDVFNACSKRIIQQEMQLIQNRIMNLTADYTHN